MQGMHVMRRKRHLALAMLLAWTIVAICLSMVLRPACHQTASCQQNRQHPVRLPRKPARHGKGPGKSATIVRQQETTNPDDAGVEDANGAVTTKTAKSAPGPSPQDSKPLKMTVRRGSTMKPKNPPSTGPSFTPTPRHLLRDKDGKAKDETKPIEDSSEDSESSGAEEEKGCGGIWRNGFDRTDARPKYEFDAPDPEKTIRDRRNMSEADRLSAQQTGRRSSRSATKALQSTDDKVSETENESGPEAGQPSKTGSKATKKRAMEASDGDERSATSKKTKHTPTLQTVVEEPEDDGQRTQATRDTSDVSSDPVTRSSLTGQSKKRKAADEGSTEAEDGMSDPMYISSGCDTDSDTDDDDDDDVPPPEKEAKKAKKPKMESPTNKNQVLV
jgi:hypothetical protein